MEITAVLFSRRRPPSLLGRTSSPHGAYVPTEGSRLAEFLTLTKPRVMLLAVFTALVGLMIAPGRVDPFLGSIAIVAIATGAGAAGVLNMWYDADIDGVMARTARRPICATAYLLFLLSAATLGGCSEGVLDPKGPIASAERLLLINATAIMLVVVVPVILATLAFAWWYRSSNPRASRSPDDSYEGRIEFVVWSIPALIVILLGGVIWIGSYQLDPRAPIPANADPLRVDVVALDWKWLFIYPDRGVAAVNQLVIPAGTPVNFRLTSATVMNSFFIPQLGSQIYTMGGMTTHLNLLADKPGEYPGFSANFSGDGFSGMRFIAKAVPAGDFDAWVKEVRGAGSALDDAGYTALAKPSKAVPPMTYRSVEPNLFERIIDQTASGPEKAGTGAAWYPPVQKAGG